VTETTADMPMIRLEQLTKRYPGQQEPAVDGIDLEVPEGEICVLVGPSGCGKTTTMKLINRIIEPTSGRIFLQGEDVTSANPDALRRRIGYVIQQIGLFPHQTIFQNVATVPKMLGWDDQRTSTRVDELLETVGMDPAEFRDRYPKELSGGQRQRVGVARAMAADPPVMLMDEPFGAIDPITRDRLQNEFLRVQADIKKTIVFVTHDIDEAIKMGDRIAIMRVGGKIAQYDTPEVILTDPADDFVEDFIGSGASLKRLNLSRVRDVEVERVPTADIDDGPDALRGALEAAEGVLLLLDSAGRPQRWLTGRDLTRLDRPVQSLGLPVDALVQPHTTLHDTLDEMLTANYSSAIVVDGTGAYQGVVNIETISTAIREMVEASRQRQRTGGVGAAPGGDAPGTT
jgi:osmoprotectant transport system ATP-binding protein